MGADRVAASLSESIGPEHEHAIQAASSLTRLGRFSDAVRVLKQDSLQLRGRGYGNGPAC